MKKAKQIEEPVIVVKTIENQKDFTKYKTLEGINRPTDEGQVKKLIESFKIFGSRSSTGLVIKTKAFSGKAEYYKADCQHRCIAATRLGIGLDIKIIELVDDTAMNVTQLVAMLNNSSKSWSTNNYLAAFAQNGVYEYKAFQGHIQKYGFTITDMLHIFCGNGGTKENKEFKNGKLTFLNEKDSTKLMIAVASVKNVIPNKAYCRRGLYKVMRASKDYNRFANAILTAAHALKEAQSGFDHDEVEFYNHLIRIYKGEFEQTKMNKAA